MTGTTEGDPPPPGEAGPPASRVRVRMTPLDAAGNPMGDSVSLDAHTLSLSYLLDAGCEPVDVGVAPDVTVWGTGAWPVTPVVMVEDDIAPLPITFGPVTAPKWTHSNTYAWRRMIAETTMRQDMHASMDLKATAERVFRVGNHAGTIPKDPGPHGNVYDGHPDPLHEFTEHGLVCPVNWSMVVAVTSTGLTPALSVLRHYGYGDDAARLPVMRTGYAHPSPEYAGEIARQLHAGERDAFAWDTTANRWLVWPVTQTLVFERLGPAERWDADTWRETHRFADDTDDDTIDTTTGVRP